MNTKLTIAVVVFILVLVAGAILIVVPGPHTANAPGSGNQNATTTPNPASLPDLITVTSPLPNTKVTSPVTISGQARGSWYFEASAPVKLKNAQGTVIAEHYVTAQGDWMTTEFVPFSGSLTFPAQPAGSKGTLVLMNDNPSGLPENQKELSIPIEF